MFATILQGVTVLNPLVFPQLLQCGQGYSSPDSFDLYMHFGHPVPYLSEFSLASRLKQSGTINE
jgi:hypothetical protein